MKDLPLGGSTTCRRESLEPRDALAVSYTRCESGVSQFACVQLYGFHSSFLIVFFPYTEDDPRSQHLVVRPTVCSTHCSCATNVHLIPVSGDDEVYHMPMSRAGMRKNNNKNFTAHQRIF